MKENKLLSSLSYLGGLAILRHFIYTLEEFCFPNTSKFFVEVRHLEILRVRELTMKKHTDVILKSEVQKDIRALRAEQ